MSTKLGQLRSELQRLQSTRRLLRLGSGCSLLGTALVIILTVAFVADWQLRMTVAQRAVLLGLVLVAAVWAWRRYMRPWLAQKDDLVDLALAVERQHGIDSELVSALQFEAPEANRWGSMQLEAAVISRVADLSPRLNVFDGLPVADVKRRAGSVMAAVAVVVIANAVWPGYVGTFLNRLLLGAAQYPTDTVIELVRVGDEGVYRTDGPGRSKILQPVVVSPFGRKVAFEVRVSGVIPASGQGQIRLESLDRRIATEVAIARVERLGTTNEPGSAASPAEGAANGESSAARPVAAGSVVDQPAADQADVAAIPESADSKNPAAVDEQTGSEPSSPTDRAPAEVVQVTRVDARDAVVFRGELPRLMDSVTFVVRIGDAESPPIRIEAIPLPTVDVQFKVAPPAYAAGMIAQESDSSASTQRQLSVLEGSRVDVQVRSLGKKLQSAVLWIDDDSYRLTPVADDSLEWRLNPEGSPLASVTKALRYRIDVSDVQGLQTESPIHGTIRLRADQAPRIAVAVRTRKIVPSAQPPVVWSASDDFGLDRVVARVQVTREDGTVEDFERPVASRAANAPQSTALSGNYRLDLSDLKLVKGDELRVTFVAFDWRGDAESQLSFSEPVQFQVTDRQGILTGLLETDEESAKQLDAIIRRELGIGESK